LIDIFEARGTSFAISLPILVNGLLDMREVICCIPRPYSDLLEICEDLFELIDDYTLNSKKAGTYFLSNCLTLGGRNDVRAMGFNAHVERRLKEIAARNGKSDFVEKLNSSASRTASCTSTSTSTPRSSSSSSSIHSTSTPATNAHAASDIGLGVALFASADPAPAAAGPALAALMPSAEVICEFLSFFFFFFFFFS
jgi:hypothetical protein